VGHPMWRLKQRIQYLMNVYNEAYNIVMNRFVDVEKLETDKLFYGAIRGMVESLGDPHSIFFNPDNIRNYRRYRGSFRWNWSIHIQKMTKSK
jgi:C-terminal processing protease CtpA/Prc